MAGPYRTRLFRPPSFEPFWEMVERRRRLRRSIPATVVVLALLPGIVASAHGLMYPSPPPRAERLTLARAVVDPTAETWGLVVDPEGAAPFTGPLPAGAARPDAEASPVPLAELQRSIAAQAAPGLARCYRLARAAQPELEGELVLHIAGRGHLVQIVLSGGAGLRHSLEGCVERVLGNLALPESSELSWLHFPLRFTPFVPVSRG